MTIDTKEKLRQAGDLLTSFRGYYIVSQALSIAITELDKVSEEHKEVNKIKDMELLYELFNVAEAGVEDEIERVVKYFSER